MVGQTPMRCGSVNEYAQRVIHPSCYLPRNLPILTLLLGLFLSSGFPCQALTSGTLRTHSPVKGPTAQPDRSSIGRGGGLPLQHGAGQDREVAGVDAPRQSVGNPSLTSSVGRAAGARLPTFAGFGEVAQGLSDCLKPLSFVSGRKRKSMCGCPCVSLRNVLIWWG